MRIVNDVPICPYVDLLQPGINSCDCVDVYGRDGLQRTVQCIAQACRSNTVLPVMHLVTSMPLSGIMSEYPL